jgi:hypothetical protein
VVCGARSRRSRPESTGDGGDGKGGQEGLVWVGVGVEWDGMRNDTGEIQPNFVLKRKENVPVHFPDDVVYITSSMRSAYVYNIIYGRINGESRMKM